MMVLAYDDFNIDDSFLNRVRAVSPSPEIPNKCIPKRKDMKGGVGGFPTSTIKTSTHSRVCHHHNSRKLSVHVSVGQAIVTLMGQLSISLLFQEQSMKMTSMLVLTQQRLNNCYDQQHRDGFTRYYRLTTQERDISCW